jgi:hypothetical protein
MSFGRAIRNTNAEALMEYSLAKVEYKKACSVYSLVRMELNGIDETDEAIIRHHRAKIVYKEACKKHAAARAKYINAVRFAAAKMSAITDKELMSLSIATNDRAIHQAMREEALANSITQEELDMARKVMQEREKTKVQNGYILELGVVSTTVQDAMEIALSDAVSNMSADADEFAENMENIIEQEVDEGKITFDEEFDKL